MFFKNIVMGPIRNNCYFLADEESMELAVIDPAFNVQSIIKFIKTNFSSYTVKYIIFTHGHFDHMLAGRKLREATQALTVCHEIETPYFSNFKYSGAGLITEDVFESVEIDLCVNENKTLTLGKNEITFIHTPGHSPGSMCILCGDLLFSGDTLFHESWGRTDLIGGDTDTLIQSFIKLLNLDDDIIVLPGHDESTTVKHEKEENELMNIAKNTAKETSKITADKQ